MIENNAGAHTMLYLIALLFVLLIPVFADMWVKYNYRKYLKVANAHNISGREVAMKILEKNGISHVQVNQTSGFLADNYSHGKGRQAVNLSESVYGTQSVASAAIAAHECGHALQDRDGYSFMRLRSSLVPVVMAVNKLSYILIVLGAIFPVFGFGWIGVLAIAASLFFQLVTLPVEFDASRRAMKELQSLGIVDEQELAGVRSMLRSAAWTYVAAVAASAIQLLRLLLIMKRRSR
ncbi:MAG: zinc metallopeptidase [bacterium]|nr:zinc metallopeptidase [bacterium]